MTQTAQHAATPTARELFNECLALECWETAFNAAWSAFTNLGETLGAADESRASDERVAFWINDIRGMLSYPIEYSVSDEVIAWFAARGVTA